MKLIHIALFASLAVLRASTACAQYAPGNAATAAAECGPDLCGDRLSKRAVPPTNLPIQPNQPTGNTMSQSVSQWGLLCGSSGDSLRACNPCCQPACCPWYASVSGLAMGLSQGRRVWTTYATDDETNQLTNSQFSSEWQPGGEVTVGHRFCCGCTPWAIQGTYWTTGQFSGFEEVTNPGGVSTPLNLNYLSFGGVSADNWFKGAESHRLWRRDDFQDIEINFVREQLCGGCGSPWDISLSAGVRFFQFHDFFQLGSVAEGHTWGQPDFEAYLSDSITNNLIGPQVGLDLGYRLGCNLRLFIAPEVGIYGNFIESQFQARTGSGIEGSTDFYGNFPVHWNRTGVAFLTQIDVGADWQFAKNWSVRAGYRVVAITGVGTADDQFPQYIIDKPEIANIEHCSSLVLHGAFAGITYNF